ncbi:MAG: ATP-dependent Clp protease adapter ClpS [Alphaproteobacteria bacterium]|nr:ATP-dependent Clp protease adapter ClpS [Alphaproteobacteria bacterium]
MSLFLAPRGSAEPGDPDIATPCGNVSVKTRPMTKKPSMYKVFLLNDDYTPMDFVVQILEIVFNKSRQDATDIMLQVHKTGIGLCGVFTFEIAETKVAQVMSAARQAQHPLQCVMEKE